MSNNMIHNKIIIFAFHANSLKVYHDDKDVIDAFIWWTNNKNYNIQTINPSGGKIYNYPDMIMYCTTSGEVENSMKEYILIK